MVPAPAPATEVVGVDDDDAAAGLAVVDGVSDDGAGDDDCSGGSDAEVVMAARVVADTEAADAYDVTAADVTAGEVVVVADLAAVEVGGSDDDEEEAADDAIGAFAPLVVGAGVVAGVADTLAGPFWTAPTAGAGVGSVGATVSGALVLAVPGVGRPTQYQ